MLCYFMIKSSSKPKEIIMTESEKKAEQEKQEEQRKIQQGQIVYLLLKQKYPKEEKIVQKFVDALAGRKYLFIPESEVEYNRKTIEKAFDSLIEFVSGTEDTELLNMLYSTKSNLWLVIPDERAEELNEGYAISQDRASIQREYSKEDEKKIHNYVSSPEMKEYLDYSIKILTEQQASGKKHSI